MELPSSQTLPVQLDVQLQQKEPLVFVQSPPCLQGGSMVHSKHSLTSEGSRKQHQHLLMTFKNQRKRYMHKEREREREQTSITIVSRVSLSTMAFITSAKIFTSSSIFTNIRLYDTLIDILEKKIRIPKYPTNAFDKSYNTCNFFKYIFVPSSQYAPV